MLATSEEFRSAARALRSTRSAVEGDRSSLERAGSIFETWRSPAADELKAALYPMCLNSLGMAIRDLGDLADTLDRAADQLDEKIHQLRRIERNAQAWFASQVPPADGSQPRWVAEWWTYRPGRFPASGDSDWFAVASYLRARGVPV